MNEKKNHRILLVEDDLISGFIAEQVLKNSKFASEYHWVKNGMDALEWLSKNEAEFILLDLSMPVMDGFDVLTDLTMSMNTSQLKVVILTSSNRKQDKDKCMEFDCVKDYIEKPLSVEKFNDMILKLESL